MQSVQSTHAPVQREQRQSGLRPTSPAHHPARPMDSAHQERPARKVLFLIDNHAIRVQKTLAAVGDLYDIHVHADGGSALEAMYSHQPNVVLVDERTLRTQGGGVHRTKCNDDRLKHIPFVIMSNGQDGPFLAGDGSGAIDHFIKRPIKINLLLDLIANSVSQQVEKSWKHLPKAASETLKTTSVHFGDIAKAVANNTPLDKSQVSASCNPLVACVRDNQHKDVLLGLRGHHNYTYVHSMRVAVFMAVFAQAYNVSKDEQTLLTTGGYMHDVGKMSMPQSLLNKADELYDEDWDVIRDHVHHSSEIVAAIEDVNPIIQLIADQHHERLDGTGYPNGLSGMQINELGRMAAIADVFAGLTDERPYKHAYETDIAFQKMEQMGPVLDQRLLKLFRDAIQDGS